MPASSRLSVKQRLRDDCRSTIVSMMSRADDVIPEVVALDAGALFSQPVGARCRLVSRWQQLWTVYVAPCCATKSSTERAFLPAFRPSFRAGSSAFLCSSSDGGGEAATVKMRRAGDRPPADYRVQTDELAEIINRLPTMLPTLRFSLLRRLQRLRCKLKCTDITM